jgi:hypothetical protein
LFPIVLLLAGCVQDVHVIVLDVIFRLYFALSCLDPLEFVNFPVQQSGEHSIEDFGILLIGQILEMRNGDIFILVLKKDPYFCIFAMLGKMNFVPFGRKSPRAIKLKTVGDMFGI